MSLDQAQTDSIPQASGKTSQLEIAWQEAPRWLALYFPALALDVFRPQGLPDSQPQIVIDAGRVSHINPAAEATGIVPGCTLATAYSISSDLTYFERDARQEQTHLADLAQALYRYSSMVSLEPPDCVVLEIRASRMLWGNSDVISQKALALCKDMGYVAVARCGATPKSAIALARGQKNQLFDVPLYVLELLDQGFSPRNLERLSNMGIYTLGQLIQLPRSGLGKRLGQQLTQYIGRLQGELPDPRQNIRPATHFCRQQHLLKPIKDKNVLLHGPMSHLAKQLEHWLIAHQQGCGALRWHFAPFKGQATELLIRFGKGRQRHQDILKLSALKLESTELPSEVLSIQLEITLAQPWLNDNQDLFGSTSSTTLVISELVDELTSRLGATACFNLQSKPKHSPERAWQARAGMSQKDHPSPEADPAATSTRSAALLRGQRPLWLFQKPQRVSAQHLHLLQGPERLTQSQVMAPSDNIGLGHGSHYRDYYVARHIQGALCWVYETGQTRSEPDQPRAWYLHGYFA
jgi:protein ImuB